MSWSLTHNGVVKSLADWGLGNVTRTLVSQGMDRVTFENVVGDMAVDTQFAFGDTIYMHKDEVQWFVGTVIQTPLTASAANESHGFVIAGPWWHLSENVFKQLWAYPNKYTGHLFLNLTTNGTALATIKTQITNTLQYLLDIYATQGLDAPYQIGTFTGLDGYPPVNEVNAITCEAVIRLQLRWAPDTVTWFDYTTSPPTLNIKRRSELTAKNVTLTDEMQVNLVPRNDILRPSVHIQYEQTTTVDGKSYIDIIDDIFPLTATGQEARAMAVPISLLGPTTNITSAELVCDSIEADNTDDATRLAWWKKYHEPFADPRYANLTIATANVVRLNVDGTASQSYPRMLIEGQIADWMDFNWEQETIKAAVSYDLYDKDPTTNTDAIKLLTVENEIVTIALVATDATSGTFTTVDDSDPGDPLPFGMAEFIYNGVSVLHYDGDIVMAEDEVGGDITFANVVNITGGRSEWTTMNALPQQITEDIDNGITRIVVGPPRHLGPADIMELLRVGRRNRWSPRTAQATGEIGDAGTTELGTPTANTSTTPGGHNPLLFMVKSGDYKITLNAIDKELTLSEGATEKVVIDLDDLSTVPADALPVKLRETIICVINPSTGQEESKTAMVLRSDAY